MSNQEKKARSTLTIKSKSLKASSTKNIKTYGKHQASIKERMVTTMRLHTVRS